MKRSKNFVLRKIAGESIIIPTGEATKKFNGLLSANETATFIWDHIEDVADTEEMVQLMMAHFDVDEETARRDVNGLTAEFILMGMVIAEEGEALPPHPNIRPKPQEE